LNHLVTVFYLNSVARVAY